MADLVVCPLIPDLIRIVADYLVFDVQAAIRLQLWGLIDVRWPTTGAIIREVKDNVLNVEGNDLGFDLDLHDPRHEVYLHLVENLEVEDHPWLSQLSGYEPIYSVSECDVETDPNYKDEEFKNCHERSTTFEKIAKDESYGAMIRACLRIGPQTIDHCYRNYKNENNPVTFNTDYKSNSKVYQLGFNSRVFSHTRQVQVNRCYCEFINHCIENSDLDALDALDGPDECSELLGDPVKTDKISKRPAKKWYCYHFNGDKHHRQICRLHPMIWKKSRLPGRPTDGEYVLDYAMHPMNTGNLNDLYDFIQYYQRNPITLPELAVPELVFRILLMYNIPCKLNDCRHLDFTAVEDERFEPFVRRNPEYASRMPTKLWLRDMDLSLVSDEEKLSLYFNLPRQPGELREFVHPLQRLQSVRVDQSMESLVYYFEDMEVEIENLDEVSFVKEILNDFCEYECFVFPSMSVEYFRRLVKHNHFRHFNRRELIREAAKMENLLQNSFTLLVALQEGLPIDSYNHDYCCPVVRSLLERYNHNITFDEVSDETVE